MEAELKKFRKRKEAIERRTKIVERFQSWGSSIQNCLISAVLPDRLVDKEKKDDQTRDYVIDEEEPRPYLWLERSLKFFLWLFLWIGFIKLECGAIYFGISLLIIIWRNMETKRKGPSAYSVFNENCEALEGTLRAEHFERQMLFQPAKS